MSKKAYLCPDEKIAALPMIPAFVDCHCHILPALDDGAGKMEESLLLAQKQLSWGFRRVVCTPHRNRLYHNTPETVAAACDALRAELSRRGIPLAIVASMEYRLVPETWPETLREGWLLPWEGHHLLIELPISDGSQVGDLVPEDEIRKLVSDGYQPVLAHPERYLYLTMDRYRAMKEAGALFQRNAGSLEGLYGPAVSQRAAELERQKMYDLLGTDLHNERYAAFFDSIFK